MEAFKTNVQGWFAKAFNLSVLQINRLQWVDYLKGIAILLVVYRHVLIGISRSGIFVPAYLVTANMIFYSFRMPLFFILSGIFISGSLARRTPRQLILTKFENLLYPYFIWAFIQVTLQILLNRFTNSNRSLIDYTYILYQPRSLDQFWYLPALFNTTAIYVLIKTQLKARHWQQLIIGIIFYFVAPYLQSISMLSDWMGFYIFFALGDTLSQLFFKESFQRFLKNKFTIIYIIPVFFLTQIYYIHHNVSQFEFLLIALIGCLSMFVLSFQLQRLNTLSFLKVLGYHSLYIYVIHVIIVGFIRTALTRFMGIHNAVILLTVGIAGGVTIPIILYNTFIKNKAGWFLFTFTKSKSEKIPVKEKSLELAPASNSIIS